MTGSQRTITLQGRSLLTVLLCAFLLLLSSYLLRLGDGSPRPTGGRYLFGTLLTDSSNAQREHAAGIRVVELELGWNLYEPQEGVFNASYALEVRRRLAALQAAGMHVVLGAGLQYPPAWVFTYPNSRYVNQFGASAPAVNLTFNQPLRDRAAAYLARLNHDLGLANFWAVRVGSGGDIETLYPSEGAGGQPNGYWAYDAGAQEGAGRPDSIPPSPFPGWRPGQETYNDRPLTALQVQEWYDWYLDALIDGVEWQLNLYRQLGFEGYQQVLMPGTGSLPRSYAAAIAHHLDGSMGDDSRTMGRGAVWHKVVEQLANRPDVVIYISSVADGSGGDDLCHHDDRLLALDDDQMIAWSATRWISYNASRYGLATMGENPGRDQSVGYGTAMLAAAGRQMQACNMQGLMWAHDPELYDRGSGITLADYAAAIVQYAAMPVTGSQITLRGVPLRPRPDRGRAGIELADLADRFLLGYRRRD
jgi:hypothetical protein